MNLALGRDIPYGLAATIHEYVDRLSIRVPVSIWLEVRPGGNSYGYAFENWPVGAFLVFDGLLTSTNYRRSRDTASLNIRFAHWAIDLNSSSSITRASHTLTPQQLSGAAAFRGGAGFAPAFFAAAGGADLFTPANLREDLWGKALSPWLQSVCNQVMLDNAGEEIASNTEGLAALHRFEPFVTGGTYVNGKASPITAANRPGAEFLAAAIADAATAETIESFASSTLWDKLIDGYAADYHLAVIPLVNTALVVPGMAGFRRPWQIIYGEEYILTDNTSNLSRPVKGVRLFHGMGSITSAPGLRRADAANPQVLAGRFESEIDGMIVYGNVPRWAANFIVPAAFGDAAAPFGPRGGAMFPGAGQAGVANPGAVQQNAIPLWDSYARALYILEALRGRTASIQGKLRFDISPGSTVELRGVEDKFVQSQLGLRASDILYGEVQSVTINVDAESLSASTTFSIKNLRNFDENSNDFMSIDSHPLYDETWNGSLLVEQDEFIPVGIPPYGP